MTDKIHVFISYATKDAGFVNVLRKDLAAQNIPYWIDKEGLRPGTINWEKGIRQALRDAFAVIYVVTPASYASDNVQGEIAIAEVEGCTIYPIWADGDKWHDCVPIDKVKTQYIDMQGDKYELNRQVLFNALGGKRPDLVMPAPTAAILPTGVEPRNPYKGLNAFTERDVADFFGRDKLISELLQAVKSRIDDRKDLLLTVIGASGSGKSSVVMAGLLPKLKAGALPNSDQWTYLKPMVPGDHPVQALANVLYSAPGRSLSTKVIDEDLSHPNGIGLLTTAETLLKKPVVLYIDQFEELFMTGVLEEERQQFINLLISAVIQADSPVLVLLTMRADFYDRPMNYPELGRLVQSYNRSVLPMSIADLRDTVEKPAAAAGLSFEAGLIGDIIFDLRDDKNAQAGALPLLQYTLEQLYEHRAENTLTTTAYQDIGGVKGAIGAHAEEVFKTLDDEAQNAFARVFQALVHVDEKGTPTRKRESEAALTSQPASARLLHALIKYARVLRVYTEKLGETPYIEVAHEALLTSWQRLADWIKSADNDLRLIQEMKAAAARWASEGKPKHRLWSHELLQPVYQALYCLPQDLIDDEKEFIRPEAERLLEDFKTAEEHIQLTMVQRDFKRIGQEAVYMLVQAYCYGRSDEIRHEITSFLWDFPIDVKTSISKTINLDNFRVRQYIAQLIGEFEMLSFVSDLLEPKFLETNDENVIIVVVKTLGIIGNNDVESALLNVFRSVDWNKLRPPILLGNSNFETIVVEALVKTGDKSVVPTLLEALQSGNEKLKTAAAKALGNVGDERIVPALLDLFRSLSWTKPNFQLPPNSLDLKTTVLDALVKIGDKSIAPTLLEALQSGDDRAKILAAKGLGNFGDKSVVLALLDVFKSTDTKNASLSPSLGSISIVNLEIAIVEALVKIGDKSVVPTLLDALHSNNEKIKIAAIKGLGKFADERVAPSLLGLFKSLDWKKTSSSFFSPFSNSNLERAVVEALSNTEDKRVVSALLDVLQSTDGMAKLGAVRVLGNINDERVVPALLSVLKSIDFKKSKAFTSIESDLGFAVIVALGNTRDKSIVAALLETLQSGNQQLIRGAATALGKVGDESAVPNLLELLSSRGKFVGIVPVIHALGQIRDTRAVPILLKAFEPRVRFEEDLEDDFEDDYLVPVVEALGQIRDTRAVPTLLKAFETRVHYEEAIGDKVAEALGEIGDTRAVPTLLEALKDNSSEVRQAAAEALGKIKSVESIPPLVGLLDHPFGLISKPVRHALELMDIPESRAALAEYDAKHKG